MNGTDTDKAKIQHDKDNHVLEDLFQQVSAREAPPEEDEALIREAVHTQWRELTRRRRRKIQIWALAASFALAVVTVLRFGLHTSGPDSAMTLASIERVVGTVAAHSSSGSLVLTPDIAHDVPAGTTLSSGEDSGAGLRWMNGAFIRLDANTELSLSSADEIFLRAGRIYLDTGPEGEIGGLVVVRTPQGLVRHLGTQFMTRSSTSGLLISVREGEVVWQPPSESGREPAQAGVGQKLEVRPNGETEIERISTWGPDWAWAEALSPGFQSDGRSLADLIGWIGRELGRPVEYASVAVESTASATVLHGDVDVRPVQALAIATATSDLSARLDDNGHIVVTQSTIP